MLYDMIYDGQKLSWPGRGVFKASSGMPGIQYPDQSCNEEGGPIPEGYYKILLTNMGTAKDNGQGLCALKPAWGIQKVPYGKEEAGVCATYWANWGKNRARMEPADISTKEKCKPLMRNGFYLHDSTKGYSHGCIEVETRIFPLLKAYNAVTKKNKLIVKIEYVKERITNGDTKI